MRKNSDEYADLDEHIRRCEEDHISIQKEAVTNGIFEKMEEAFSKDTNICFFVHDSQYMFYPVFRMFIDVATPEEHALLNETVLMVSKKFTPRNFTSKALEGVFLKRLYSKENTGRLKKFGLVLSNIEHYEY